MGCCSLENRKISAKYQRICVDMWMKLQGELQVTPVCCLVTERYPGSKDDRSRNWGVVRAAVWNAAEATQDCLRFMSAFCSSLPPSSLIQPKTAFDLLAAKQGYCWLINCVVTSDPEVLFILTAIKLGLHLKYIYEEPILCSHMLHIRTEDLSKSPLPTLLLFLTHI